MFFRNCTITNSISRLFVVVLSCIALLAAYSVANAAKLEPYRLAISSQAMGGGVDNADAAAALKAWALAVEKEQSLTRPIDAQLFTGSMTGAVDVFQKGGYHGLGLTVGELLKTGITPKEVFVGNRGDSPFLQYVIVVANKSKVQKTQDLVKRRLVTSQSNQMLLAQPWYEALLREEGGKKSGAASLELEENLSKAILKVFFDQADGALVTKDAFDLACELNPQVCKNIRILCESPSLIPVLFIFQPKVADSPEISELERALLNLHKTPGGLQVLTVIQSYKMEKYPFDILQSTIDLIEKSTEQ